ncbi:hypothetical protein [Streptomyces sp. NPDC014734]|uniref:hypothetical protein n=1 Tax=Streptomyces sp. NPDC014734 TaxID=3364886 RepID=UPI0036FD35B7
MAFATSTGATKRRSITPTPTPPLPLTSASAAVGPGKTTASNVRNALEHRKSHRGEFPELQNAKQYVEKAHCYRQVAKEPKPPTGYRVWDRLDKSGNPKGYVVYEKKSNTLVSCESGGVPKTMNRPAPKSASDPRGFRTGIWPTLEDYLKAQGQHER